LAKKKKSKAKLIKDLDKVFSLYIRLRNSDQNGTVECYTSGKLMHYKDAHAGHFISRRHLSTRWNEINVQVQSVGENLFNQGNAPVFAQRLLKEFGEDIVDKLILESKRPFLLGAVDLEMMIEDYKSRVVGLLEKLQS